jgi:uncharacterized protein
MKNTQKKLVLRFIGWFFLCNAVLFLILGSSYFKSIVQCTTLFQNLVFDYSSIQGKAVVITFISTTFLSYMVMLAFIPASIIFLLAIFIPNKKIIWCTSILAATLGVFLLLIDIQVYSMFKFHLNSTLLGFIFSWDAKDVFDMTSYEILIISGIACLILLVECSFSWLVWNFIILRDRYKCGKSLGIVWIGATLFSYFTLMLSISVQHNNLLIQQAANLPLYNSILPLVIPKKNARELLNRYSEGHYMQAQFSHDKLNYPRKSMRCAQANSKMKPYNIIFIMVDSLRLDSLRYMPNTSKFASENWQFMKNISGGNSTQSGLFSLFYSIPSSYWTAALEQHISPVFIDLLLENNYKTKVIWSSEMHNPPMHKTIYQKLSNLNIDGMTGKSLSQWDLETTKKSLEYLEKSHDTEPFFLNIFYNAPHAFCNTKDFPIKYKPVSKECSRISMKNDSDPSPYYNSYLNTVDFIDGEIGRILKTIEEKGYLQNSIVIFTSDHGQEFNENHQNFWGHASNYSSYQVQVPLIIHWPHEQARKFNYLTSGYDLMPTLLSRIFNCNNDFADYSVGYDLLDQTERPPFILSGSYVNTCIIEPDRLTTLHLSGEITITDPHLNPIEKASPRESILNKSLSMMRAFYR